MIYNREYQRFTEGLAKDAGLFLRKNLGKVKKISYKGRMNLVTDVDTRCEELILTKIKSTYPEHRIISEESGSSGHKNSEYSWLIDPLDGTTNYAHSFGFFCVSVALLKSGQPIVGVVYDPLRDELFSAVDKGGSRLNGKKIRVSQTASIKKCLLATGFPYRFGKAMKRNVDNFVRFMMKSQAVRRAGSAALDLCYVACGRFDGFWELDLHPWDTAAGWIIVKEAGGRITDFKGKAFDPFKKEIIASNSRIHKQMQKVLR